MLPAQFLLTRSTLFAIRGGNYFVLNTKNNFNTELNAFVNVCMDAGVQESMSHQEG